MIERSVCQGERVREIEREKKREGGTERSQLSERTMGRLVLVLEISRKRRPFWLRRRRGRAGDIERV